MASLSATRLQVFRPAAATPVQSRRYVVAVNAATGGERAAPDVSEYTPIGLGALLLPPSHRCRSPLLTLQVPEC